MKDAQKEILNLMQDFINDLDYAPIKSMFDKISQGKMLRSKLILSISDEGKINKAKSDEISAIKLAAIVEFVHLASLLHDDVLDNANLRRGQASINAKFGDKNAIMLGDILYSKAFYELSSLPNFVAKSISNAVLKLAKGELMDIELSYKFNSDESAYLSMIEHKTAALIEASAISAAHLAGLDSRAFGEYGRNLGLAFQIIDDILDVKGDAKTLGKPAMSDFKEGKSTLIYINLFKKLPYNEREILQNLFKKELNLSEIEWLKTRLNEHKIIEQSFEVAKNHALIALNAIKAFKNEALSELAQKMIDREF